MFSHSILEKKASKLLRDAGVKVNGKRPWDIQVNDESLYFDGLVFGSLGLGDGYINGKWDVQRIDLFFEKILTAKTSPAFRFVEKFLSFRDAMINTQAGKRAFSVGKRHYDLGNKMYEYMLGESMGYSCGMYLSKKDDLTKAQYNKFDALCKKLELKPGMKVLEIGAGWGTFARHAAKNYGVKVVGLTVSEEQKMFAENRCKGLPVKFLLLDYQKMGNKYYKYFDRVVSIEMIEAVGKKNFRKYFETIENSMKNDGLFGLQAIVGGGVIDPFISTRIFPNGLVPSTKQIVDSISGLLQIKHWESFGQDYDKTLQDWDSNFRKNWKKISALTDSSGKKLYDEKFYRMWRYYLMCCAASFRVGDNDDAQIIMSKLNAVTVLK